MKKNIKKQTKKDKDLLNYLNKISERVNRDQKK
jgi:hypothetical protein